MPSEKSIAEEYGIRDWPEKKKFLIKNKFFRPDELKPTIFRLRGWSLFLRLPLSHIENTWTAIAVLNQYGVNIKRCRQIFRHFVWREVANFSRNPSYKPYSPMDLVSKLNRIHKLAREWGYTGKKDAFPLITARTLYESEANISKYFGKNKINLLRRVLCGIPKDKLKALLEHPDLLRMSVSIPGIRSAVEYYLAEKGFKGKFEFQRIEEIERMEEEVLNRRMSEESRRIQQLIREERLRLRAQPPTERELTRRRFPKGRGRRRPR